MPRKTTESIQQADPLMPHATATWLVENTALTFRQIAAFCGIHVLEVQAIADETTSSKLIPRDPVRAGELTQKEIDKGEASPDYQLKIRSGPSQKRRTSGPRYTPLAKRRDKPDGIAWIIRHYPEITDAQISRLIGTTKPTIASIRNREHWNMDNITPKDPVTLGLCAQRELDALIAGIPAKPQAQEREDRQLAAGREAVLAELEAERESEETQTAHVEPTAETLFRSDV